MFLGGVFFLMFSQSTMGIHPTAVILSDSQTWVSHHPPQKDRETHFKNGSLILRLAGTWMYDDVCTMLDVCRFCFRYLLDIYAFASQLNWLQIILSIRQYWREADPQIYLDDGRWSHLVNPMIKTKTTFFFLRFIRAVNLDLNEYVFIAPPQIDRKVMYCITILVGFYVSIFLGITILWLFLDVLYVFVS